MNDNPCRPGSWIRSTSPTFFYRTRTLFSFVGSHTGLLLLQYRRPLERNNYFWPIPSCFNGVPILHSLESLTRGYYNIFVYSVLECSTVRRPLTLFGYHDVVIPSISSCRVSPCRSSAIGATKGARHEIPVGDYLGDGDSDSDDSESLFFHHDRIRHSFLRAFLCIFWKHGQHL
jgi:hypothetical protein